MEKGPDAFRTISEVAEDLDLPQHVLRFWETRFPQIRPLKRGGGRRYYRPDDVELLRGIRHLLYSEGYTIRGVQRILKEEGPRYVQAIWRDVEAEEFAASELDAADRPAERRPARDPVDSGHPGRGRDAEPAPRSGPLSGLLNLLPSRQRDVAEDPASSRRANPNAKLRRAPDSEPGFLELPLLPDLAPQSRPTRAEPPSEPQRSEPVRRREPEVAPPEVRRAEVPPVPLRPAEPRPNFPFRAVAPEPAREDGYDQYDEEFEPEPPAQFPPEPVPAARPVVLRPVEEPIARVAEPAASAPSRVQPLSPNDIQRLQATLYELQECRRLLDAARE